MERRELLLMAACITIVGLIVWLVVHFLKRLNS